MDARFFRAATLAALVTVSMGASYKTPNFVVQTDSPELAQRLGKAAEQYRRELAVEWLGKELPDWSQPCVMTVQAAPHLGAGGATTFIFDQGEVFGWRMTIQGSAERLFDSVLPHEITHMIFASHFRQPLPRWADEGGATSVEHPDELARHRRMLVQFLKTNRGIAFNRMFAMTEYPPDVMPLYAQGFSLADYLIQQGGRRKYIAFLGDALKTGRWSETIRAHYGVANAGTLQNAWLTWVRQGSPRLASPSAEPEVLAVAAAEPRSNTRSDSIYLAGNQQNASRGELVPIVRQDGRQGRGQREWPPVSEVSSSGTQPKALPPSGWHAADGRPAPSAAPTETPAAEPLRTQVTHPQPVEQAQQIILEWDRRSGSSR